jgi:hypothetical protein
MVGVAGGARRRCGAPAARVEQRRTAAARWEKCVNTLSASVSSGGCTGRLRASRVTHLGDLGAADLAGAAARRREVARELRRPIASTGKQGRGKEAAGEYPHPNAKLLELLLDGGERRSGGAASDRGTAVMVAAEAPGARVSRAKGSGYGLGRGARAWGCLNRAGQASGHSGQWPRAAEVHRTCAEVGDDLDGRASPFSEGRRGKRRKGRRVGGLGRQLGRARGEEEKKEMGHLEELGRTVKKEKKK